MAGAAVGALWREPVAGRTRGAGGLAAARMAAMAVGRGSGRGLAVGLRGPARPGPGFRRRAPVRRRDGDWPSPGGIRPSGAGRVERAGYALGGTRVVDL